MTSALGSELATIVGARVRTAHHTAPCERVCRYVKTVCLWFEVNRIEIKHLSLVSWSVRHLNACGARLGWPCPREPSRPSQRSSAQVVSALAEMQREAMAASLQTNSVSRSTSGDLAMRRDYNHSYRHSNLIAISAVFEYLDHASARCPVTQHCQQGSYRAVSWSSWP